jgi:hypothetical protein
MLSMRAIANKQHIGPAVGISVARWLERKRKTVTLMYTLHFSVRKEMGEVWYSKDRKI